MRVILTHAIADDTRALLERLVVGVPEFEHRVEDPAVDGLEAVAHVWQRAPDDDRHRIVEIRLPHLVFDGDRNELGSGCFSHAVVPLGEAVLYRFGGRPATEFAWTQTIENA